MILIALIYIHSSIVIVIYNRKIVNEILTLIHEYLKGVKFDITQGIERRKHRSRESRILIVDRILLTSFVS